MIKLRSRLLIGGMTNHPRPCTFVLPKYSNRTVTIVAGLFAGSIPSDHAGRSTQRPNTTIEGFPTGV